MIGLYRRSIDADYRGRTPVQLAAELGNFDFYTVVIIFVIYNYGNFNHIDRDKAVLFLLSIETSPARCSLLDKFGHPVLTTMIFKMPQMVL